MSLLALALVTSGCGGGSKADEQSSPESVHQAILESAQKVAQGLEAGNLKDAPRQKRNDPTAELGEITKGLNGLRPKVTVSEVRRLGSTATADLQYDWPLSAPWRYTAKANFANDNGTWKLIWEPTVVHPKLTAGMVLLAKSAPTSRGTISSSDGAPLVEDLPAAMLGLNKAEVDGPEAEASAKAIAKLLGIDEAAYVQKVMAASTIDFVEAVPARQDSIPAGFTSIKGAGQREIHVPMAKTYNFARAVLGEAGPATPEEAAKSHGTVAPGQIIGKSGIQQSFDRELRGMGTTKVYLVPKGSDKTSPQNVIADFPEAAGATVNVALDEVLQTQTEELLAKSKAAASVVVIDVLTGGVVVAADSPTAVATGDSLNAQAAPGLTAGPMSALALVRSGVDLNEKIKCEPTANVGGENFDNGKSSVSGTMSLKDAIAKGCRTAIAAQAGRLAPEQLVGAANTLGIGKPYELGTPTNMGSVPAPASEADKAKALLGEGGMTVSPLALAAAAASVQSTATTLPWIAEGREPKPEGLPILTADEANALLEIMKTSGESGGLKAALSDTVGGKRWTMGYTDKYAIAYLVDADAKADAPSLASVVRAGTVRTKTTAPNTAPPGSRRPSPKPSTKDTPKATKTKESKPSKTEVEVKPEEPKPEPEAPKPEPTKSKPGKPKPGDNASE